MYVWGSSSAFPVMLASRMSTNSYPFTLIINELTANMKEIVS